MRVDLQQLKNTISVPSVFEQAGYAARKNKIPCPFCATRPKDKSCPSMYVRTKTYHCYRCEKKGDIFNAVMDLYNVGFREALGILAGKDTVEDRKPDPHILAWDECEALNRELQEKLDVEETCWRWDEIEARVVKSLVDKYLLKALIRCKNMRVIDDLEMEHWVRTWEIMRRADEGK